MKRGARLFYIMGALIVLFTIWMFLELPFDVLSIANPSLGWYYIISFFVWFSVGLTEIAVGYLLEKQME